LDNAGDITVDSGSTLASGVSGEPMNNTGTISILNGSRLGVSHGAEFVNAGGGTISIGAGSTFDVASTGGFRNQLGFTGGQWSRRKQWPVH
jgi:hypothetical protein